MDDAFSPVLTTADWNEEWKRLQTARGHADNAAFWDERAKTFPMKHGDQSGYVARFLELASIAPGETVLDMGCGTGSLATPLAQAGCRVIACDFSRGMLDKMRDDQASLGVEGVESRIMSWADDWEAHGLGEGCADVAIASRSIATDDLRSALMKLHRAARRRVCITLAGGSTPRADGRMLSALGFDSCVGRDFLYAFNILASCGIYPEVSYIESKRTDTFATVDEAREVFGKIARDAVRGLASLEEVGAIPERLEPWLEAHLDRDADGNYISHDYSVTWAFLSWNKREGNAD